MTASESELLLLAINAAIEAGLEAESIYHQGFEVDWKADQSPVTVADLRADAIIRQHLQPSGLEVISEEVLQLGYDQRQHLHSYWCVDPIDGTRDFVSKTDHFCVCIALIQNRQAHIGVIYLPIGHVLYYAVQGWGAFRATAHAPVANLGLLTAARLPLQNLPQEPTLLATTYHMNHRTQAYIQQLQQRLPTLQVVRVGSAIKFCWLAEGRAHHYPRFGKMNDWDMAAGHAIAQAAGARLRDFSDQEIYYNDENLYRQNFMLFWGEPWPESLDILARVSE